MFIKDAAANITASTAVSSFLFVIIYKSLFNQPDNNTFEGNIMVFIFFSFIAFLVYVDSKNTLPVEKPLYITTLAGSMTLIFIFLCIVLMTKREFESHYWKKVVSLTIFLITLICISIYVASLKSVQFVTWFNYIIFCTVAVLLMCAYKRKKLVLSIYLSVFMFFVLMFSILIEHIFVTSCDDLVSKRVIFSIVTLIIIIVVALYKTQKENSKYKKLPSKDTELKDKLVPKNDGQQLKEETV